MSRVVHHKCWGDANARAGLAEGSCRSQCLWLHLGSRHDAYEGGSSIRPPISTAANPPTTRTPRAQQLLQRRNLQAAFEPVEAASSNCA